MRERYAQANPLPLVLQSQLLDLALFVPAYAGRLSAAIAVTLPPPRYAFSYDTHIPPITTLTSQSLSKTKLKTSSSRTGEEV